MPVTVLERIINLSSHKLTLKNQEEPKDDCAVQSGTIQMLNRGPWIPWASAQKRMEIRFGDAVYYLWQDNGADGDHVRFSTHDAYEAPSEKNRLPGFSQVRWDRHPITLIAGPDKAIRGSIMPFASWMADLESKIAGRKLNEIIMPGTHDAGTYSIPSSGTELSPDSPAFLAGISSILKLDITGILGAVVKTVIAGWARVQDRTITEQLEGGVRYFDLRLCAAEEDFYIVHGMWGAKVDEILGSVDAFIASHPKEIVLLDFSHFYKMDNARRQTLATKIVSRFGNRLIPRDTKASVQLSKLWSSKQQVIVFFSSLDGVSYPTIWPSSDSFVPGQPWDDNRIISELQDVRKFLDDELKVIESKRSQYPDRFTRIGATYSSNNGTLWKYPHLYKVTETTAPEVMKWLRENGTNKALNVVNTDFFELASQVDTIVAQNLR